MVVKRWHHANGLFKRFQYLLERVSVCVSEALSVVILWRIVYPDSSYEVL